MKRISAIIAAAAVMLSLTACNDKKDKESGSSESAPAVTDAKESEAVSTAPEKSEETEAATAAEDVTETVTSSAAEDFTFPEDEPAFEAALDEEVIAAAQALFEKACETEWNYTVGSPYELDVTEYITNEYDWQYYLITEEGINSLDDVRADFHRVFSVDYEDTLDELYVEEDGRVYCLNGARGSDVFYEGSEVTEITGRSDGEIRFSVVNSYNGSSFGGEAYTEETEFVIAREDDGKWKVSEFKLPY